MDWILAAVLAVGGAVIAALVYRFLFAPSDEAEGRQEAVDLQRAKADGIKLGAEVVERRAEQQLQVIDEKAAAEKRRDPVDIANDIIKERKS